VIRYSPTDFINLHYDAEGNISKSDHFYEGILKTTDVYSHTEDQLQKIETQSGNLEITTTFEFDSKGNLATKTISYEDQVSQIHRYSNYDEKPNPLKGNQLIFASEGFDLAWIDYFSNNNPMHHEIEWITHNPHVDTFNYNYKYNEKNLWTSGRYFLVKYDE
jgi:hypothetical protein